MMTDNYKSPEAPDAETVLSKMKDFDRYWYFWNDEGHTISLEMFEEQLFGGGVLVWSREKKSKTSWELILQRGWH
jgi:hypothetical protein